jgi:MGT family glycosyltransferase
MFTVPAHGHVNPSLAVVRELVRRGHRVSYVITEQFAEQVARTGAEPVLYETTWPTTPAGQREQWSDDLVEIWTQFLDEAVHALPQAAAALRDDRPDLLLQDIGAYEARVLAHRWQLPLVQLSPSIVAWEGYEEEMAALFDPVKATPEYRAYERRFLDWLAADGIALGVDEFVGRPERALVLIPRALQPHAERVSERCTFVGPCVEDRAEQDRWEAPADGRRVLLISLGSAFTERPQFYRDCVEAFGGGDWHVVLAIGQHVDPAALGELPGNVELHRFAPQLAVLEHASAFVTHAGMGSAKEGLAAGVPLVAVPQAADQFGNAERIAELGVGLHLPAEEVTPTTLRDAVERVSGDPAIAARVRQVGAEMAAEGGTTAAADAIEALLERTR